MMGGYDVIGDVHGNADKLEGLLKALGYAELRGAWRHPDRQAVFVGDRRRTPRGGCYSAGAALAFNQAGSAAATAELIAALEDPEDRRVVR